MNNEIPTNATIRQYLLGGFDGQLDLEMRLSEQLLLDHELSEIVDSIEDEIIEDYLDGTVSAEERISIEKYFLRPAERRQKLQFSLLLRNRFKTDDVLAKKKLVVPSESAVKAEMGSAGARAFHWGFQVRTWGELAALILLAASGLIYVSGVRKGFQSQLDETRKTQAQLEDQLAREREHIASLTKQLLEAQPPVAVLTFLGPDFRAGESSPVVDVRPWTQQIKVEIDLQNAPAGNYGVRLETEAGKTIWSQSAATASSGGLRFEIPAQNLSAGKHCLAVSSRPKPYCFRVRIMK